MAQYGYARPETAGIDTPFGPAVLEMAGAGRVRVTAGVRDGSPPLRLGAVPLAVDMTFVHSPGTGRFSLLADGAAMAWIPGMPGSPPPAGWIDAALSVEAAVEGFVEAHPEMRVLAEVAALERILEDGAVPPPLLRERAEDLVRKRRSLMGTVG